LDRIGHRLAEPRHRAQRALHRTACVVRGGTAAVDQLPRVVDQLLAVAQRLLAVAEQASEIAPDLSGVPDQARALAEQLLAVREQTLAVLPAQLRLGNAAVLVLRSRRLLAVDLLQLLLVMALRDLHPLVEELVPLVQERLAFGRHPQRVVELLVRAMGRTPYLLGKMA